MDIESVNRSRSKIMVQIQPIDKHITICREMVAPVFIPGLNILLLLNQGCQGKEEGDKDVIEQILLSVCNSVFTRKPLVLTFLLR